MRHGVDRFQIASGLRLLSALALLCLAVAVFWQPLQRVLAPGAAPALRQLPLPKIFGPRPAEGFMVRVVSRPSGATVRIDDTERGSTPLFGNVACQDGQDVRIAVAKQGFPVWSRTVPCRVGGELTVQANLGADETY